MFSVYKTIFSIINDDKLNDICYATNLTKIKKNWEKLLYFFMLTLVQRIKRIGEEYMMSNNKKNTIYGVDITKKVTPIMVRDAIIQCFFEAHDNILELAKDFFGDPDKEKFEHMKKTHVKELVENIYLKIGEDFNNPTKENLLKVIDQLKKIAKIYRNNGIINTHVNEIMQLINKI